MNLNFKESVNIFKDNSQLLISGKWGLEREFLRVDAKGHLAQTPHPPAFGDKLENPNITTDFSESQVELITPPLDSIEKTHAFLTNLQDEVLSKMGDEYIWPLSMPGRLPSEDEIPIASYNDSEQGKENESYRKYLAKRYGKKMQMLTGIHYNYSFSDRFFDFIYEQVKPGTSKQSFRNDVYFSLGRNFLRFEWLYIYLFGASPAVDQSYESKYIEDMEVFGKSCICMNKETYFLRNATSLRMSRLGYSNHQKGDLHISHESLDDYIKDIRAVVLDKTLINEKEYYSPIRFKPEMHKGETQLDLLSKNGVNHIEIRTIDLNPFEKLGISKNQLYFTHIMILYCLFEDSQSISEIERLNIKINHEKVGLFGRRRIMKLRKANDETLSIKKWGKEILAKMQTIAKLVDKNYPDNRHADSVKYQFKKLRKKKLLASTKMLKCMSKNCSTYLEFGIKQMNKLRNT